ncbi:MAG: hypothetical protein AB1349_07340 [Elusimicrobiota bacterium]
MKFFNRLKSYFLPLASCFCRSGQVVVIMLILAMVIAIIIPALVYFSQHEAKWTTKETKSTRAFHLAEAGIDRGVFALNGEENGWNNARNGIVPSGYDGGTEFTDIAGGRYKIRISSGPESGEVTIASVAQDTAGRELRGIRAIYSRQAAQSAIDADGNIGSAGSFEIHWGAIKSRGNINLTGGAANRYYPRKYARGNIDPRNPPDTDDCEYWAKETLPDLPEVDLPTYLERAKAYNPVYENGTPDSDDPSPEGGYHEGNVTFGPNFRDYETGLTVNGVAGDGDTPTYYVTGNVTIKTNTFIRGDLICLGNLELKGNGWANTAKTDVAPNYRVFIPNNARKEYFHKDGCTHTTAQDVWTSNGWANGAQATLNDIMLHGLIYVDGNITSQAGNQAIVGVVIGDGNTENLNGNSVIYYNEEVADNVIYQEQKFTRESWTEFAPGSWNNPNW